MPRTPKQYFRWLLSCIGLFDKTAFLLAIDEIRKDDIFLVSYPKSGNTWLRFILANLTSNEEITFRNIDEVVPDIYTSAKKVNALSSPRFIKVHYDWLEKFPKSIYIVRDYRDVLVSYYHYHLGTGEFNGNFSEYIRKVNELHPFGSWKDHTGKALAFRKTNPEKILFLRYEDLLRHPEKEIEKIISFAGIQPKRSVKEIISLTDFTALQNTEKKSGSEFMDRSGKNFFREGRSGSWKDNFSKEDLDFVMMSNGKILKELGYE
jgi:hypothetical protein